MRIKTWGCRGSLPRPGPSTLRYGGNSTCLEIRSEAGQLIIVDAGTGVRDLGKAIMRDSELTQIRFLFTHAHLDHLIGFPFFEPAYSDRFSIRFCGGLHAQESVARYLTRQMSSPYFPVGFGVLGANFETGCGESGTTAGGCGLGDIQCRTAATNHPNGGCGFRLTERGKTFVFLTDNELGARHEGGLTRDEYVEFCRDADLLFHDAQYTDEEYGRTRGWGHSTFADATDLALDAGVKRLGLFHHDPDRTDDDLDRQVERCRERIGRANRTVECFAVAEGSVLEP